MEWIEIIGYCIISVYTVALVYITFYCVMQFHLLFYYKKHHLRKNGNSLPNPELNGHLPFVTIQLPIYNELYVVNRLIDNIVNIDYPKHKFEIQVLDDSTDGTRELARNNVEKYRKEGFQIYHLIRNHREGYKAGALKEGMKSAKGEFIAIFDADFLPKKDFLRRTLPYFENKKVGVVQTRWEHINQNDSLITKLQAFQLNVHFTVEQQGRKAGNLMLQFNGTAGVWRTDTILEAGGWEADTLTEDLDLSYRAQLKGWEIIYLEDFGSPSELPSEMSGLKSQQYRWMKGGAETAKKMLPNVWKSSLSPIQKLHASIHLLSSSIFLCIFLIGIFSVPLIFLVNPLGFDTRFFVIFLIGLLLIIVVYYVANVQASWKDESTYKMVWKFLFLFPVFLALSMGLSLHNSIAVLQGFLGKKTAFVRTPKLALNNLKDIPVHKSYLSSGISLSTVVEGLLALYFTGGIIAGVLYQDLSFIIFHLLLALGYSSIFYFSVKHLNYQTR